MSAAHRRRAVRPRDRRRAADGVAWRPAPRLVTPPFGFTRIGDGSVEPDVQARRPTGSAVVLRRPPLGRDPGIRPRHGARAHGVERAVARRAPACPRPLAFCADADVCGAPFYVMEHVDGLVLSSVAVAETLDPGARRAVGLEMAGDARRAARARRGRHRPDRRSAARSPSRSGSCAAGPASGTRRRRASSR